MKPDRKQTEDFIAALTGSADTAVTWQVFPDQKGVAKTAPENFHATLETAWPKLVSLNQRGASISVMVNEGDGEGRCAKNVVSARALFVDDDEGSIDLGSARLAVTPPTIVVKTKRGIHVYWRLKKGEALGAFIFAQRNLAGHFNTDPAVSDWPRAMRVPGFLHQKDPSNPFLVQVLEFAPERRYTIAELMLAFPAPPPPKSLPVAPRAFRPPPKISKKSQRQAVAVLEQFRNLGVIEWAFENPDEVGYEAWRGIATNIAAAVLEHPELHGEGERFFHELSSMDLVRYLSSETAGVFREALKSAEVYGPMRYDTLLTAGVPEEACLGAEVAAAPVAVARQLWEAASRSG